MACSALEKELNLMLIGMSGVGKSATGNTILGQRIFKETCALYRLFLPTRKDVVNNCTRFDNFLVKVVDCPGLMETDMDSGEDKTKVALNMAKGLGMCNGGVDAFILVLQLHRFTDEKRKSLEELNKIFGDRYTQNLIVVVTGGDKFKDVMEHEGCSDMSLKDWFRHKSGACKKIFDDISDRFLVINNREKDPHKNETQRREIIQLADTLRNLNGRYTSKHFEDATVARDTFIVEDKSPVWIERLERKVNQLSGDILRLKEAPSERERARICKSLDDLMLEIREKDNGTGILNYLMVMVGLANIALHEAD